MADSLGAWRRLYTRGVTQGRRINSVSWQAEAWLWRLMLIADDYGTVPADPDVLRGAAAPKRKLTPKQMEKMNAELADAGLLIAFEDGGEQYLSLTGFTEFQKPANGRLVSRYPKPPGADGGNRGNPVQSVPSRLRPDSDQTQTNSGPHSRVGGAALEGGDSEGWAERNAGVLVGLGVRGEIAAKMGVWFTSDRVREVAEYVRRKKPDNPGGLAVDLLLKKSTELHITPQGRVAMKQDRERKRRQGRATHA